MGGGLESDQVLKFLLEMQISAKRTKLGQVMPQLEPSVT